MRKFQRLNQKYLQEHLKNQRIKIKVKKAYNGHKLKIIMNINFKNNMHLIKIKMMKINKYKINNTYKLNYLKDYQMIKRINHKNNQINKVINH